MKKLEKIMLSSLLVLIVSVFSAAFLGTTYNSYSSNKTRVLGTSQDCFPNYAKCTQNEECCSNFCQKTMILGIFMRGKCQSQPILGAAPTPFPTPAFPTPTIVPRISCENLTPLINNPYALIEYIKSVCGLTPSPPFPIPSFMPPTPYLTPNLTIIPSPTRGISPIPTKKPTSPTPTNPNPSPTLAPH